MALTSESRTYRPFTVPAGTPVGAALRELDLPNKGPEAIVVVKDAEGRLKDLAHVPEADAEFPPVPADSADGRAVIRHSCAHVLAQAVQAEFPGTKLGIGPAVENGFYYDFDAAEPFTPEDLKKLEKRMKKIIKTGQRFERRVWASQDEARQALADEPFKLELIDDKGNVDPDSDEATEVGAGELLLRMLDRDVGLDGFEPDARVEGRESFDGGSGLVAAHLVVQHLPLEVVLLDDVAVQDRDASDAGADEVRQGRAAAPGRAPPAPGPRCCGGSGHAARGSGASRPGLTAVGEALELPHREGLLDAVDEVRRARVGLAAVRGRHGQAEREIADDEVAHAVLDGDAVHALALPELLDDVAQRLLGARVALVVDADDVAARVVVAHHTLEGHDRAGARVLDGGAHGGGDDRDVEQGRVGTHGGDPSCTGRRGWLRERDLGVRAGIDGALRPSGVS